MPTTAQPSPTTRRFAVTGMTCDGCVNAVTRVLMRVPGTTYAQVTLATGQAEVAGNATPDALLAAVRKAGYGAEVLAA